MIKGIRFSIDFDKQIHKKIRQHALDKDTSMRNIILEAVQLYFKDSNEQENSASDHQ